MTRRQTEIIDTAIKIIASEGIQNLTIKNLSKAVGVSEPAIYRHFSSKTEILLTMLENLDSYTNAITEEILRKQKNSLKMLEAILYSYFSIFSEHPYWVAVIFSDEIFKNEKSLSSKVQHLLAKREETFVSIIARAQKENLLRKDIKKQHQAIVLMGALRLLVKRWELSSFSFDLQKEGKKLTRSLMLMLSISNK